MKEQTLRISQVDKGLEKRLKIAQCIFTGVVAGFLNGLFGGGGGMVVVPMLTFMLKREQKKAHATAILIILPMSIVSGLLYASGKTLEPSVALPVSVGVTAGGILGALALKKLSSKWVGIIFSIAMAAAGLKMLIF